MLLIGEKYRGRLEPALKNYRSDIIWLPDNPNVDERLSGHADLMVYIGAGKLITVSENQPLLVKLLTNRGSNIEVCRSHNQQEKIYPHDCGLCVRSTGEFDIYNPETIDPAVAELLHNRPIYVNQGYTACTVCAVDSESIITSDTGIAAKACNFMDVLLIRPGFIELPGFNYGFIGGAAFLIEKNTLAFTGSLEKHPDKDRILAFLREKKIQPIFLTDKPVWDIGGAIELP